MKLGEGGIRLEVCGEGPLPTGADSCLTSAGSRQCYFGSGVAAGFLWQWVDCCLCFFSWSHQRLHVRRFHLAFIPLWYSSGPHA